MNISFSYCQEIQFEQVYQTHPMPQGEVIFEGIIKGSVAFADIDGDLDLDVLFTGRSSNISVSKLFTNDGSGIYTEITGTPFEGVFLGSVAFADVDGDLDQDVLITGQISPGASRIAKLYTNDGSGVFTEVMDTPFHGAYGGSIAFADIDGDLDQDVLITGVASGGFRVTKLYSNDGSGVFTKVADTPFELNGPNGSIAFADIDGDLDQDVLITDRDDSYTSVSKLYTNDGSGVFTEVTRTPFDEVASGSIAFADMDGDLDQDVLITGLNTSNEGISKLYSNDGNGVFTEVSGTPFDGIQNSSIAFSDIDGDLDQDLLIIGLNNSTKLYSNDGSGVFTEIIGAPFDGIREGQITFADINGDLSPDVLITGLDIFQEEISKLYINNGSGVFTEVTGSQVEGIYDGSVAFADIDGDLDQDVLISGLNSLGKGISKLYSNDGSGVFTKVTGTPFDEASRGPIAFLDIDGDLDQDVIIAGSYPKLYSNDGSGVFTEVMDTPFEGVNFDSGSFAFSDVDGDLDQDVLISGIQGLATKTSQLYSNDGSGVFTKVTGTPFAGILSSSITFSDIDGDLDQDVLITGKKSKQISKLYRNDGSGVFTEVMDTPFEGVQGGSVAFSDIDGDLDQDVLITGKNGSSERISKLYINDGGGVFTEVPNTAFDGVERSSVAFTDIDGDLDQDVLITGYGDFGRLISKLYSNDGSGVFTEVTDTPFEGVQYSSVAFSDIDGDLDQDVLITGLKFSTGRVSKLYRNTTLRKPSVITSEASAITAIAATLNGDITSDGGAAITERGFVYALSSDDPTPTLEEENGTTVVKTAVSGTIGSFNQIIAGSNDTYSYAAFANNSIGTTEGSVQTFTIRFTWSGATNTDWNTTTNWLGNVVPISTDDVLISNTVNDPVITSDIEINSIYVETGAVVTVSSNSLKVTNDITLEGNITVISGASLVPLGTITGAGVATIHRNTTFGVSEGKYSVIGSPITAGSTSSLGNIVYSYDETIAYDPEGTAGGARFVSVATPETMVKGNAYFSANTGNISFVGTPNSGDIDVSLIYDEANDGGATNAGFNLVSNPYPAAISFPAFVSGNPDIDGTVYVWDDGGSNVGTRTNSDYIVANSLGIVGGSGRIGNADGYLRSTQGFFVKATSAAVLHFTPSMMATTNNSDAGFFREAKPSVLKFSISLGELQSNILVGFSDKATVEFDRGYDAYKFKGNNLLQLSSKMGQSLMAIQTLPILAEETQVDLGFDLAKASTYTFKLEDVSSYSFGVYLKDHLLNKSIDLLESNSYTFESTAVSNSDRFSLVFSPGGVLSLDDKEKFNEMLVFSNHTDLNVSMTEEVSDATVSIYSVSGTLLKEARHVDFIKGDWTTSFTEEGLFIITVQAERQLYVKKFIR